jgi:hypothetical protein
LFLRVLDLTYGALTDRRTSFSVPRIHRRTSSLPTLACRSSSHALWRNNVHLIRQTAEPFMDWARFCPCTGRCLGSMGCRSLSALLGREPYGHNMTPVIARCSGVYIPSLRVSASAPLTWSARLSAVHHPHEKPVIFTTMPPLPLPLCTYHDQVNGHRG